jgi:hypothetical protein
MTHYHIYFEGKALRCTGSAAEARKALEVEAIRLIDMGMRVIPLPEADAYLVTDVSKSLAHVLWVVRSDGAGCPADPSDSVGGVS